MTRPNGVLKSFGRTTKLILAKFLIFHYIKQIDNILPLSVQLQIHGRRHNVVRTSVPLFFLTTL